MSYNYKLYTYKLKFMSPLAMGHDFFELETQLVPLLTHPSKGPLFLGPPAVTRHGAMGRVTTIARSVMTVTGITARGAKLNRSKICRKAVDNGSGDSAIFFR